MKLRDAICPFFFIAICTALFFKWKDEKWVPSDLGKQERDSLRIDARARAQEAAKWEAKADSARGWHDRELATALPVETLYMQAHAEALSLPVAAKWAFMGQLPDTGITR